MPTTSPLTESSMPVLTDAANIETAVQPSILNLEKYAIPRFSSLSARNAAFVSSPPELGQVIYVSSQSFLGYQVWNGEAWEEFGKYTRLRELVAVKESNQIRTQGTMGNITGMTIPVEEGAVYSVECYFIYWVQDNHSIRIGFNFPGNGSRMSTGGIYKSPSANTSALDNDITSIVNHTLRVSGDTEHVAKSYGSTLNGIPMNLNGTFRCAESGDLQPTFSRVGGDNETEAHIVRDSWVKLKRIA